MPCKVDVRSQEDIQKAIDMGVKEFGGIDILVNNASAIQLTGTLETDIKRYDLMNQVNSRGTWLCSKLCIPYLLKSNNPHILNLSPPLLIDSVWFKNHTAYTIAKYGMSMSVLGMSEEFRGRIGVNALWPLTTIATAAVDMLGGDKLMNSSRKPSIMSDAAWCILTKDFENCTGNFFIDEDVLREEGITDFNIYAHKPGHPLSPDFFVPVQRTNLINSKVDTPNLVSVKPDPHDESIKKHFDALQKKVLEIEDLRIFSVCFQYNLKYKPNEPAKIYTYDMRYGTGKVIEGKGVGKPDSIITMSVKDFGLLVNGSLNPREAFSSGRLTVRGDRKSVV